MKRRKPIGWLYLSTIDGVSAWECIGCEERAVTYARVWPLEKLFSQECRCKARKGKGFRQ